MDPDLLAPALASRVRANARQQDVLDLVNNHPLNNTAGVSIAARLSSTGGGIEIVDSAGRPITINAATGSPALEYLGLAPTGAATVTSATGVVAGTDQNFLETASVFNTLIRLRDALASDDRDAASVRLREILSAGPVTDDALHAEALGLLRESPAMKLARETVRSYAERSRAALRGLPDVPARRAMESLCDFIADRTG